MSDGWAIDIDRSDITRAKLVPDPAAPLSPGQVRVRIDSYAMTANNITYAVFGHPSGLFGNDQGYWDFFAERDRPGRLPVWGFATVVGSAADGIAVGDRFYGYYPMASHAVLTASAAAPPCRRSTIIISGSRRWAITAPSTMIIGPCSGRCS